MTSIFEEDETDVEVATSRRHDHVDLTVCLDLPESAPGFDEITHPIRVNLTFERKPDSMEFGGRDWRFRKAVIVDLANGVHRTFRAGKTVGMPTWVSNLIGPALLDVETRWPVR